MKTHHIPAHSSSRLDAVSRRKHLKSVYPGPQISGRSIGFLSILTLLAMIGMSSSAQAVVFLNFDTASQLDSLSGASSPSVPPVAWSSDAGVGGSGGVTPTQATGLGGMLYSPGYFDATVTGVPLSVSYYFFTPAVLPTSQGQTIAGLGLVKDINTDLWGGAAADRITISVLKLNNTNGWGIARNNSTSSGANLGDFSISPETWYKLEGIFTQNIAGQWGLEFNLWNYGSTGTESPTLVSNVSATPSIHTAYTGVGNSTEARLGVLAMGTNNMAAFDLLESNISIISEPTGAAMLLFGLGAMGWLQRGRFHRSK